MTGSRHKDTPPDPSDKARKRGVAKPEPPPIRPDDDLYETGDIAAPEPDRDDDQRGL